MEPVKPGEAKGLSPEEVRARLGISEPAAMLSEHAGALVKSGHYHAAVVAMRRALALCPGSAFLMNGVGMALWNDGDYAGARAVLAEALRQTPESVEPLGNMALCLSSLRDFQAADESFARALAADPENANIRWNRAVTALCAGDWRRGFDLYEARFAFRGDTLYPQMPYPMWQGEDLTGKTIYLQAEQGIGDRILFTRYIAWLKARWPTAQVKFLASSEDLPSMASLLWEFRHLVEFLPTGIPYPEADYGAYLMSLARHHGTTAETVPADPGLIRRRAAMGADNIALPEPHVKGALKVGICWGGSYGMSRNAERSLPLELLLALEENPRVQLYGLQFGPQREDIAGLGAGELVCDLAGAIGPRGLAGTAMVMLNLDLVITVCTANAHLAGALGVPVWVLLCNDPYWVWLRERDDSPWYPTARLFRQPAPNAWRPVIDDVKEALAEQVAMRRRQHAA